MHEKAIMQCYIPEACERQQVSAGGPLGGQREGAKMAVPWTALLT